MLAIGRVPGFAGPLGRFAAAVDELAGQRRGGGKDADGVGRLVEKRRGLGLGRRDPDGLQTTERNNAGDGSGEPDDGGGERISLFLLF